jgi:aspartate kinase
VVVLAGFQGVSPRTKEITTLGRGGSDTTAVAMAAYFKAERCEIRKDVDGVHSADPSTVRGTTHIPHLHYSSLLDMTFWGAKVLHYRSVELAMLLKIPVLIALAHSENNTKEVSTLIDGEAKMYEDARILSVNTHKEVRVLQVNKPDFSTAFAEVALALKPADLPMPQFLSSDCTSGSCSFLITAPQETLNAITQIALKSETLTIDTKELSSVTATCQGAFASALPGEIATALKRQSIATQKLIFGAMSITVIVDAKDREKAVQTIHDLHPSSETKA